MEGQGVKVVIVKQVDEQSSMLVCSCGATAPNNKRYVKRFLERHPKLCSERKEREDFTGQLAQDTRSVSARIVDDPLLDSVGLSHRRELWREKGYGE
jgi:hypothetical protein